MYRQLSEILISFVLILGSLAEPDCSRPPPFANPHLCCQQPKPNDLAKRCARTAGFPLSVEEGKVSTWMPFNVQAATCFADCILNESHYIRNGELDMNVITADIQEEFASDGDYVPVIVGAFKKCGPIAKQKMTAIENMPFASVALRHCSPFGGLVLGCVYMEYFMNCPASKWTGNSDCDALRDHIRACSNMDRT